MPGHSTSKKSPPPLSRSDELALTRIKASLYDNIGTDDMLQPFVQAVGELLGSDFTNFTIHSNLGKIERLVTFPEATAEQFATIPKINEFMDEQPVLDYFRAHKDQLSFCKISDFITTEEFRKTNLYKYGFGPMGFDHMLSAAAWDTHDRLYLLNLTHPLVDFGEHQRLLLQGLFPTFLKAFQLKNLANIQSQEIRNVTTLTRSQKEIMNWVGEGKTNQEISTITRLSPKTVEKHIRNICKALGFHKRMELLDYCVKQTSIQFPAMQQR